LIQRHRRRTCPCRPPSITKTVPLCATAAPHSSTASPCATRSVSMGLSRIVPLASAAKTKKRATPHPRRDEPALSCRCQTGTHAKAQSLPRRRAARRGSRGGTAPKQRPFTRANWAADRRKGCPVPSSARCRHVACRSVHARTPPARANVRKNPSSPRER
jgi:hypothetical protein